MIQFTVEDLKLMASELTRIYGKETAQEIMLKHKDNLNQLAFDLGKRSIKFFTLFYLRDLYTGDGKAELSQTHFDSWHSLTNMFNGKDYNKKNFLFPRGFGKTAILSTPTVIWAHCYGYSTLTVLGSAIKDTATSFMVSVKEGLSQPRIIKTFGQLMKPNLINNTENLELDNNSLIMVASSRTNLRGVNYKGTRINLLILDDYQSEENTNTNEARDKHWNKFQRNALPAVEKDKHWVLGFGTTQCKGDFYDRLTNDPTFETKREPAVKDVSVFESPLWQEFKEIMYNPDLGLLEARRFYNKNKEDMEYERIWDYFKCEDLAILYFSDREAFIQEYQLEFVSGQNKLFTNIVHYDDYIEPSVLVIDPATASNPNNDYSAFVAGTAIDNITYVPFAKMERLDFEDYISTTIEILKEFPSIVDIVVEKQTYNRADVVAMKNLIARDSELAGRDFNFINEHQSKNKQSKIESIVGDVNLGRVQFHSSLALDDTIAQLKEFTHVDRVPHDDFVDALAEMVIYLRENDMAFEVDVFDIGMLF